MGIAALVFLAIVGTILAVIVGGSKREGKDGAGGAVAAVVLIGGMTLLCLVGGVVGVVTLMPGEAQPQPDVVFDEVIVEDPAEAADPPQE